MNSQTDEPLSGQQMQQIAAKASAALQQTVDGMGLRRRCLELAAQVCVNYPDKVVEVAAAMFEFVSQPTKQVMVKIERDPP